MSKLVIGCGYLGHRVARAWRRDGQSVFCVTRSNQRAQKLSDDGFKAIVHDLMDPASVPDWPSVELALICYGYDRSSSYSLEDLYVQGLARLLDQLSNRPPARLIYTSSTGVYGTDDDSWVDEQTPCEPRRAGGRACLAAENLVAGFSATADRRAARTEELISHHSGSVVLRLAGLYGPGRIPRRDDLLAGKPIPASDGYLNLIHVDDAAAAVQAAAEAVDPQPVYAVVDDLPVRRTEYYQYLAELIAAPAPVFTSPPEQSPLAARALGSKRIRNQRLKRDLLPTLKYPSYREGLAAILAAEQESQA